MEDVIAPISKELLKAELTYARWNSRTNGYDSYTQTTVYELNDSNAALMLASTK